LQKGYCSPAQGLHAPLNYRPSRRPAFITQCIEQPGLGVD
jgi:hypothetical protein